MNRNLFRISMNRNPFRVLPLVLMALVFVLSPRSVQAQTTQSVGLDFTTADTLVLTNTGATVDMGAATATDYDNGYIDVAAANDHTLNVAANTTWQVAVKGDTVELSEAWTKTGADCPVAAKPVGSIDWSTSDTWPGTALTALDVVVASGGATASSDINIDYRVDLAWTVDTGICTYDYDSVIFTLSAT